MNILFYVEPRVDVDEPASRQWWVRFCVNILNCIGYNEEETRSKVRIITNSFLSSTDMLETVPDDCRLVISSTEFSDMYGGNPGIHRKASLLNDGAYEQYVDEYSVLLKQTCGNFKPDIILTFLPEPALSKAFPNVPILHHESGAFYVVPFPTIFRLDPCGLAANSWPYEQKDKLRELPITNSALSFMKTFREKCLKEFIVESNPFIGAIKKVREKFEKIWLLPLSVPQSHFQFPMPDSPVNDMSQYDFIIWVVRQMPVDHAVIITEHPLIPFLDKAKVDSIKTMFPNAIFLKECFMYHSASQPLVPLVDGVITLGSGVGYQASLFQKKLICPAPRSFLMALADSEDVKDAEKLLSLPYNEQNDVVFHHLLTHYFVPETIFRTFAFIRPFFEKTIKKYKVDDMGFEFYDAIATDDEILEILCSSVRHPSFKRSSIVNDIPFSHVSINDRENYIIELLGDNEGV